MSSHWLSTVFGDFAHLEKGISYKSSELCEENEGLPFINLKSIDRGGGYRPDGLKWYSGKFKNSQVVKPGDLILCCTDLTKQKAILGYPILVPDIGYSKFCISLDLAKIVVDENRIIKSFLFLLLQDRKMREFMQSRSSGTTVMHLKTSEVPSVEVELPPMVEQKRIVDLISTLDSYIKAVENQLEKISKARKAVLHQIFHTEHTDWQFTQLDKCTQKISDGSHNPPKGVDASEYLMLSSKDIWDGYMTNLNPRYLEEKDFGLEAKRTQLEVGDVLLTIVGTIGRCAVYRGYPQNVTFQRSVCVIKPNKAILNADFLMMYLQSIQVQLDQDARGVAQRGIYLNQIRSLDVPTPPMEEQLKVVSILGALDEVFRVSKVLLQDAQGLRSALLSDLISGEHQIPSKYDEVMREI